jgi:electron transfer flavoprotein beta subunit
MKIVVLAKQTFATEARIELDEQGQILDNRIKKVINPYDEFAVEEAIQWVEKGVAEKVTVVSLGPTDAQEALRQCLAMGADEAFLIDQEGVDPMDPAQVAMALAAFIRTIPYDLLLSGSISIDTNSGQVALRVAEILGLPHVLVVSKLILTADQATAWREADGQTEILTTPLPALITADKSLNKPRYPTLPNIMKAKKKPLKIIKVSELGISLPPSRTRIIHYHLPPPKKGRQLFKGTPQETAAQLVQALHTEAKVI